MQHNQITPEWIEEQRQISEIVDMVCEDAPGSVVPLLKQIEKSQTAALDALEAAYAEKVQLLEKIERLTAERDAVKESNNALESDIYNNELNLQTLTEQIDRITAERDAAARDLKWLSNEYKFCVTCKRDNGSGVWDCNDERCDAENHYEWRGPCAANQGGTETCQEK